jgi:hypothetical protein
MIADNALANFCIPFEMLKGGDTGRRKVEYRSFLQLIFTHQMSEAGHVEGFFTLLSGLD